VRSGRPRSNRRHWSPRANPVVVDTNVTDPGRNPAGTVPPAGGETVVGGVMLGVVGAEVVAGDVVEVLVDDARDGAEEQDAVARARHRNAAPAVPMPGLSDREVPGQLHQSRAPPRLPLSPSSNPLSPGLPVVK